MDKFETVERLLVLDFQDVLESNAEQFGLDVDADDFEEKRDEIVSKAIAGFELLNWEEEVLGAVVDAQISLKEEGK